MSAHPVVSHEQWLEARKRLLAREKTFTRERDTLSQERRDLPWEKVDKEYVFDGPRGKETLADVFAGKSQLVVYHFMFGADWSEGCPACSFWADNFNGIVAHLRQRDTTMVAISRASLPKLEAFKKRMGWSFKWVSSGHTDFNRDFFKDSSGAIFHTYSAYARGIDLVNTAYNYLDLVPKGRDESGRPLDWIRHRDKYKD
jgi:predicted dithiol-disulfide oxidoreductase (DUF899 family)